MNIRSQHRLGLSKLMRASTTNSCPHCGESLSTFADVKWYNIEMLRDADGRVVAHCTDTGLTGAITDGKDEDEALENIIEAIKAIEEARK